MAKAYDKVEWHFLEQLMIRMGFLDTWVKRLMSYVTSLSYALLFNARRIGHISPSRAIRQGDPLSLYLFLLIVDNLSTMLIRASHDGYRRNVCKTK